MRKAKELLEMLTIHYNCTPEGAVLKLVENKRLALWLSIKITENKYKWFGAQLPDGDLDLPVVELNKMAHQVFDKMIQKAREELHG